MKKVIISITALVFLFASFFALEFLNENSVEGSLSIVLIDEFGETVFTNEYEFKKKDTLFDVLSKNHIVGCADSSYNISSNCDSNVFSKRVIMKIDDVETDWTNSYFAIYINDTYAILGIDDLNMYDGDIIKFEYKLTGGGN